MNQSGLGLETARTIDRDPAQEPPETAGAGLGVGAANAGGCEGACNGAPLSSSPEPCGGRARAVAGVPDRTEAADRAWKA
jgi:hypothetical protein